MRKSPDSILITAHAVREHVVFVARKTGRRMGGASLWLATAEQVLTEFDHMRDHGVIAETGHIAILRSIEVNWMHRCYGLGSRLVEMARRAAVAFGAEAMYVHSVDIAGGDPSLFYRACGFTVERRNGDSNST
jgi:GNAT superfamily N-acetyltransferase